LINRERVLSMTAYDLLELLKARQLDGEDMQEPVFCLRGRDPLSESTILFWVRDAIRFGVPTFKIHGAVSVAKAMKEWPEKKIPS